MWSLVLSGVTTLFQGWIKVKTSKQEAEVAYQTTLIKGEQDWDIEAQKAAKYSWKDEFITIIWFAPLIVAWFKPQKAQDWIDFVIQLPYFYQFGMFGIMAASFGLRWYFKQQAFKVGTK